MLIAEKRKNVNTQKNTPVPVRGAWANGPLPKDLEVLVGMSESERAVAVGNAEKPYGSLFNEFIECFGECSGRVLKLGEALLQDVYRNPPGVLEALQGRDDIMVAYGHDLFMLMEELWEYSIFSDNGRVSQSFLRRKATEIVPGTNLYLTKEDVGMPVPKFLLYYKGSGMPDTVGRLAGMSVKTVENAYQALILYMVDRIGDRRRYERRRILMKAVGKPKSADPEQDALVDLVAEKQREQRVARQSVDLSDLGGDEVDPMEAEVAEADGAADEGAVMPWDDDADTSATTGEPDGDKLVFDQYPFDPDAGNDL